MEKLATKRIDECKVWDILSDEEQDEYISKSEMVVPREVGKVGPGSPIKCFICKDEIGLFNDVVVFHGTTLPITQFAHLRCLSQREKFYLLSRLQKTLIKNLAEALNRRGHYISEFLEARNKTMMKITDSRNCHPLITRDTESLAFYSDLNCYVCNTTHHVFIDLLNSRLEIRS